MRKTVIGFTLCALIFALCFPIAAQQQAKIPKIGELVGFRPGPTLGTGRKLFRQSLRELGYVEGKSILYEDRSAEGKLDRFPALADELVRLKVDVLVASSPDEALAFTNATKTIPIVILAQSDPVAAGLVDSLARPGGEHHGNHHLCNSIEWQTDRVAQGNRPKTLPRCRAVESSRVWRRMERKPACGAGYGSTASFHGGQQRR
jgi:ABC-type uncharacterized transport system substrate-binding protein